MAYLKTSEISEKNLCEKIVFHAKIENIPANYVVEMNDNAGEKLMTPYIILDTNFFKKNKQFIFMNFCSFSRNSLCICIESDIEKEREREREKKREKKSKI